MKNQKIPVFKKINIQTILLVVVLVISLMNGCNSCNTKRQVNKIQKQQYTIKSQQDTIIAQQKVMMSINEKNFNNLEETVKDEATMGLILEKEIDDRKIKSSEIKQLVNDYRK